jgi:hypothetical protein
MKMEQCFETSAYKIQTSGNYPEENIQYTAHGESFKSRLYLSFTTVKSKVVQWAGHVVDEGYECVSDFGGYISCNIRSEDRE